ncbi:hypothetical protein GO491_09935 [Flavobacteriaceae bacterium Ap0902]|nr:hypothetical protein [Flavobacteriaceae bacterium Ap0902]
MKILIFESWNNSPQFETGLEIAEIHAEKGDKVTYVNIGGFLPFVEWQFSPNAKFSKTGKILRKLLFDSKMERAKKVINKNINFNYKTLLSDSEIKNALEKISFKSLEELKNYEWKGIDIGMATTSSLISVTNDLEPDIQNEYIRGVQNIIDSAKIVALSFEKWLDKIKPDLVYFRNGRVALYRPVLRICEQRDQNFLIHDRGNDKYHYVTSPDLRHNFEMVNQEIIDAWEAEKNTEKREKIAAQFYQDRRSGVEQAWQSYLDNQKKDILPENWDNAKHNITFFNSSISEYVAISKVNNKKPVFEDQIEAINYIIETIKNKPEFNFYLRLHPNLMNQSQREIDLWMSLESNPHINLIHADSKVDTYAMMLNSDLNIAFLSSTAIESAYYNKPIIQLSKSNYHRLGSTYFPQSKEEFKDLLLDKDLKPKDNLGARKFGYYMNTFGTRYQYFEPKDLNTGTYRGTDLQRIPLKYKILMKLKNIIR